MLGYIISDKDEINVENYEIQSFDILHKTNLNIFVIKNNKVLYKNNIIHNASGYGHVQVLEWFKKSGYEFNYTSRNGHNKVLEWFKKSGYEFNYAEYGINEASQYGHVQVLEWFKNSGYEFKYNEKAICDACSNNHNQVLEWFKNSGYDFKYTEKAMNNASSYGYIKVFEWFKNSGYEFKYTEYAFRTRHIKILKFFSNHFNVKKLIKWSKKIIFIKTINFKTHNKYLKGYQKN
jgi:hypothetical protein